MLSVEPYGVSEKSSVGGSQIVLSTTTTTTVSRCYATGWWYGITSIPKYNSKLLLQVHRVRRTIVERRDSRAAIILMNTVTSNRWSIALAPSYSSLKSQEVFPSLYLRLVLKLKGI